MVGHYDGERVRGEGDAGGEFCRRADDEGVGVGKTFRSRERRARIRDGHVPAEFVGEVGEGLGVVAGAKNCQCGWREN